MKRRLVLTLVLLVFFGGPLVGLFYFWGLAHRQMQGDAEPFAKQAVADILSTWDYERLSDLATLTFRPTLDRNQFEGWRDEYGAFRGVRSVESLRSYAGGLESDQRVWQYVEMRVPVTFERGTATVVFTAARRSIPPDWRIEKFEVQRSD